MCQYRMGVFWQPSDATIHRVQHSAHLFRSVLIARCQEKEYAALLVAVTNHTDSYGLLSFITGSTAVRRVVDLENSDNNPYTTPRRWSH